VKSFPLRVVDPDRVIHAFVYDAALPPQAITRCNKPCGTWPVQVGGDPTCEACLQSLAASANAALN